ncbi:MAG: hypothetical protein JXA11_09380 [Phycisphaerae bacterium]|nr:hypothetical protein [Phycisphaerae bacterium]
MIIEHTFVTTREADQVGALSAEYLQQLGFRLGDVTDEQMEAKRGRVRATSPKIELLPMQVNLSFDRGRVVVVANLQSYRDKDKPRHEELMKLLITGLEWILCDDHSVSDVAGQWRGIEADIQKKQKRGRGALYALLIAFGIAIAVFITIAVVEAN